MRDPERIPVILDTIKEIWEKYPDLRLSQLIINAYPQLNYYTEDDLLLKAIQSLYSELINNESERN